MDTLYNLADIREAARRRLPRGIFDFIDRGAEDELAVAHNAASLARVKLMTRTMVDVSKRSTSTDLFGREQSMPLAIAPTGAAGLVWYDGEIALARAAAARGVPFTLATRSMTSIESIAGVSNGTLWFQLYLWSDRQQSYELVDRAAAVGFDALIVTVDTPAAPNREYNKRNGFNLPFGPSRRNLIDLGMHPRWLFDVMARYLLTTGMPRYENTSQRARITQNDSATSAMRSDNVTWDDLKLLRKRWPGVLMLKGILHPDDAELAIAHGVDAVIVSNHGGRALDAAAATIDVLPRVVDQVNDRARILIDGGIRRGSDIVKALALGASAVLTGRPNLYGCAVGGQVGVEHVLQLLQQEMSTVMAMIGCANVADVCPEHIYQYISSVDPARTDASSRMSRQPVNQPPAGQATHQTRD